MVLCKRIVVDDSIVVVEKRRAQHRERLESLDATRQAMREVTGPIVATALVSLRGGSYPPPSSAD